MLDFLIKGGPVMVPLLLCSVVAVAIALERLWYLAKGRVDVDDLLDEVKLYLHEGKSLEAIQAVRRSRGPVAAVVGAGLSQLDKPLDWIRQQMEEAGQAEVFRMERRLGALDAVITIAPLLGLLGTVTGIIRSFNVMAALEGIEHPSALSGGIAEALITTAAGLIIAIPTMAVHAYLVSVIDRRVADMNRGASEVLSLLAAVRGQK